LKVQSPAKINLFLHIAGKRPDGYHDLISLMCCIGLFDTITLAFGVPEISVACDHPQVPEDESNLAFQAADLFFKRLDRAEGVSIAINKQIPVAAGLGGGSSNAAAVLAGLNRHYTRPFSQTELMAMGRAIGADVPFFIYQKPALATGIGDQLDHYEGLSPHKVLIVNPGFGVSTETVYKNFNLGLTKCKKKLNLFSFKNKDFDVERHLCNDLEMVVANQYPEVIEAKKALLKNGAAGGLMSGSGPTVFGLFSDAGRARKAKAILSQNDNWQLFLTDMIL
jgi:4-diphosphocytidyl-2-C-methyl-D-erythritol kinase